MRRMARMSGRKVAPTAGVVKSGRGQRYVHKNECWFDVTLDKLSSKSF